jgi:biopolymer transport protein ExbB
LRLRFARWQAGRCGAACNNRQSRQRGAVPGGPGVPWLRGATTIYNVCPDLSLQEFVLLAILQAAGWPIWLLLIASIVATALIIERLLFLRRAKILPRNLLDEVVQVYRSGAIKPDTIQKLEQNSPLGVVLAAALRNVDSPREVMKESIEEAGSGVAHMLERFLTTLGTIATLAPLMGLFGTVVGMIEIFGVQNNPAQLAHGVSVALYNTGFGLAIAMPALVFYRHFRALVDGFIIEMEQQAVKFVDVVHSKRK